MGEIVYFDYVSISAFAFIAIVFRSVSAWRVGFSSQKSSQAIRLSSSINKINPVEDIKTSCHALIAKCQRVVINESNITKLAKDILATNLDALRSEVAWDSSGWHYTKDTHLSGALTCQYIFVLDSLNFCFWPTNGLEYDYLASSLKKVLESDESAFDASKLATLNKDQLSSWFPLYALPLLDERVLRLREVGRALLAEFDGLALNMVLAANHSAAELVKLVLQHFPGFRDTAVARDGQLVHFYKRAQILCGDVWAAYGRPGADSGSPFYFHDIDSLTMFADYRVPQLLRALGVLQYCEPLAFAVDNLHEIDFASTDEIEIRACTIVAVDRLHQEVSRLGCKMLVIELDWLLWQRGEAIKDELLPHHRTRTIYY